MRAPIHSADLVWTVTIRLVYFASPDCWPRRRDIRKRCKRSNMLQKLNSSARVHKWTHCKLLSCNHHSKFELQVHQAAREASKPGLRNPSYSRSAPSIFMKMQATYTIWSEIQGGYEMPKLLGWFTPEFKETAVDPINLLHELQVCQQFSPFDLHKRLAIPVLYPLFRHCLACAEDLIIKPR